MRPSKGGGEATRPKPHPELMTIPRRRQLRSWFFHHAVRYAGRFHSAVLLLLMAPLGDAAKAALEAELGRTYRGRRLNVTLHATKLVDFFVARGEALTDLPLDVETHDTTTWRELWLALCTDAGIAGASDQLRVVQWLEALEPLCGRYFDGGGQGSGSGVGCTGIQRSCHQPCAGAGDGGRPVRRRSR